jgi:hypothetical protein
MFGLHCPGDVPTLHPDCGGMMALAVHSCNPAMLAPHSSLARFLQYPPSADPLGQNSSGESGAEVLSDRNYIFKPVLSARYAIFELGLGEGPII